MDEFFKDYKEKLDCFENVNKQIYSVEQLTNYIKNLLESDKKLVNVLVRGEISNYKEHSSGHIYFSLKDEDSQIRCVLFKRVNKKISFKLNHGMKIIVKGNLEVYSPRGEYSLILEEVQPDGIGSLNLAFIQLKEKLEKQGLFSEKYKKSLPKFPKTIGVITSLTGAAIQDILNIIKKRYPIVKIIVAPALVQGRDGAESIVEAIKLMNKIEGVDCIILGRGGGSLEDLWCFNEEIVARSIFESKIPIISAIGHETDFTIADFVADYRAPTPSAAAEKVVPDMQEIYELLYNLRIRNIQAIKHLIKLSKSKLKQLLNNAVFQRPFDKIHRSYKELDYLSYKLQSVLSLRFNSKKRNFEIIVSKLLALSPDSILKRGYSIVLKNNKIIKNSQDIKLNDKIDIFLANGKICAKVEKIIEK